MSFQIFSVMPNGLVRGSYSGGEFLGFLSEDGCEHDGRDDDGAVHKLGSLAECVGGFGFGKVTKLMV